MKEYGLSHNLDISIHSLRMEGDTRKTASYMPVLHFNPLPPHGGRRLDKRIQANAEFISIHSLRMEGDRNTLL